MHGVDTDIHVIPQQSAELVSDARMYLRGEFSLKIYLQEAPNTLVVRNSPGLVHFANMSVSANLKCN